MVKKKKKSPPQHKNKPKIRQVNIKGIREKKAAAYENLVFGYMDQKKKSSHIFFLNVNWKGKWHKRVML